MEQQLFTIILEQQWYDIYYMIWITRIGSTRPRVVCYWNTSEVKEGKLKIQYGGENKENHSNNAIKEIKRKSSSQDGSIGRNPSLPHTTKRRLTTNLKSINNQKHQKIKLYRTPTTKELRKTQPEQPDWYTQVMQANSDKPQRGGGPGRWGWLKAKLRLRVHCGNCCGGRKSQSHSKAHQKVH